MPTDDRAYMTIKDVQEYTSLGRSTVYKLISAGAFDSLTCGSRRLVVRASVDAYFATLKRAVAA